MPEHVYIIYIYITVERYGLLSMVAQSKYLYSNQDSKTTPGSGNRWTVFRLNHPIRICQRGAMLSSGALDPKPRLQGFKGSKGVVMNSGVFEERAFFPKRMARG